MSKETLNAPFAPIVADMETPLMAMVTLSVFGGFTGPGAEIVPPKMTEAVPGAIAWDAVSALKAGDALATVKGWVTEAAGL